MSNQVSQAENRLNYKPKVDHPTGDSDIEELLEKERALKKRKRFFNRKTTPFYLMILPALVLIFMFKYMVMPGKLIAFMDWRISGFQGWVGLTHFKFLVTLHFFWQAFINHWRIVLLGYVFLFPAPIFFAILLNEIRNLTYRKGVQTLTVLPNFLNWVIIAGIFTNLLSPRYGYVNDIIQVLGGDPIYFLSIPEVFPWLITFLRMWKGVGYSAIIYLAALSAIDAELYESAVIDGAA